MENTHVASLLLAHFGPSAPKPRWPPFQPPPLFIPHPLSRPPLSRTHLPAPPSSGPSLVFTPLRRWKEPISPAVRVWRDGRQGTVRGKENTPGELREASDLALTVPVDPPTHTHTYHVPAPRVFSLPGSFPPRAPCTSCLLCLEYRTCIFAGWVLPHSALGSNVTFSKKEERKPSLAVPQLYWMISSFCFYKHLP